jgi:hypothetical protein
MTSTRKRSTPSAVDLPAGWLPLVQAAERLGLPRVTLWRWTRDGRVASRRITEKLLAVDVRQARALSARGRAEVPRGRPKGEPKECARRGCGEPARARGLCVRHYQQARRG